MFEIDTERGVVGEAVGLYKDVDDDVREEGLQVSDPVEAVAWRIELKMEDEDEVLSGELCDDDAGGGAGGDDGEDGERGGGDCSLGKWLSRQSVLA